LSGQGYWLQVDKQCKYPDK